MTQVAQAGDTYIGEYHFDNLSVINGAKLITEDNIYIHGTLNTVGGIISAANIYQMSMLLDEQVEFMFAKLMGYFNLKESPKEFREPKESKEQFKLASYRVNRTSSCSLKPETCNLKDENIQLAKADFTQKEQDKTSSTDPAYTYDLNGNRTQMTDPTGVTYYTYDALNRLTSMTNSNGKTITYSYDALSRRTQMSLPNGVVTNYSYDALSQLKSISHQLASTTLSYNYSYDAIGNRTSMADSAGSHNYTYDTINRLISATHPLPSNPLESFEYDKVGNRTNAGSYTYDSCNRLLEDSDYTYTYDNNGNLTQKTKKITNEVTTYTYNVEDQLIRGDFPDGTFVSYRYDGLGRRIEKNLNGNITQYYYDNEDILLETDGTNTLTRYTHGPGIDEPLIMDRDGQTYYYHSDGLGSITTVTDSAQETINSYTYDSFGNIINSTGSLKNPYTYTSREYDAETSLYYYRARYYDPYMGRFLQEDPIGFWGGVNFYTYCYNNPINFVDPIGLYARSGTRWWLYESVVPGPHGQPISEWELGDPTRWGDPMRYTEEAGGPWMWAERGVVGIAVGAVVIAGWAIIYEIGTGKAILVEGAKGTRIIQIRPAGEKPWIRVDYGPVPKTGGGKRLLHWHQRPDLRRHLPWNLLK